MNTTTANSPPTPKLILSCLLALGLCAAASATTPDGDYNVVGQGNKSCGWVVSALNESPDRPVNSSSVKIWLAGYLTAANRWHTSVADLTAGTDLDGLILWIKNRCNEKPLANLASVTEELIFELDHRSAKK